MDEISKHLVVLTKVPTQNRPVIEPFKQVNIVSPRISLFAENRSKVPGNVTNVFKKL